jgi:parvulin-like peptidyl-prolyl isomerase
MTAKKDKKIITPKQTARAKQERKKTRTLRISFGLTLLLIVGLAGFGIIRQNFFINRIPIAKVDDVVIDTRYFQDRTRLERNAYIQQYQILNAQYQMFADDPGAADFYINQLLQIQQLLDADAVFGELVIDKIIIDQVVALEAEKLGISISDTEIEEGIQVLFSYYPSGTPTPRPTPTFYATPTFSLTQEAILNDPQTTTEISGEMETTPAPQEDAISEAVETEAVEDQPNDSSSEAAQPTESPAAPTGTPAPTATVYTEDLFQEKYLDYIGDLKANNILEENMRKYISHFLLNQKVKEEVIKDVSHTEPQVWARHILVKTKSEGIIVLSRLENGESWADIAADVSLDTSNKNSAGDLGWFPKGRMVPEFENAAFDLQMGEISDPIETDFGWHIIQIVGIEERQLDEQSYKNAQDLYYEEWLESIKEEYEIEINEVWREVVPSEPMIPIANRISP